MRVLLCAVVVLGLVSSVFGAAWSNSLLKRRVDVKTAIVRVRTEVTMEAVEDSDSYTVQFLDATADRISRIVAKTKEGADLSISPAGSSNGLTSFDIKLPSTVSAGESSFVKVTAYLTHVLSPFPTHIEQGNSQMVVFTDTAKIPSPYASDKQVTTIKLPGRSPRVDDFTRVSPSSLDGDSLKYGPYKDVPAGSSAAIRVHFENNAPFATITNLDKEVEVSHWGNVAVEEQYDLANTGAILDGGFSRIDYQMRQANAASFRSLHAKLPLTATDIYYRDIIGNISTSSVREGDDFVEMEIETRFPMFGGWKTQWYQGYNMPSEEALTVDGDTYTLTVGFASPYENVVTDHMLLKVILPEGASVVSVEAPVAYTELPAARRHTYLDGPTGRTVVSLTADNLVPSKHDTLTVVYTVPPMALMREPAMLVSAFFCLFLSYSVLSRIDLSIGGSN